MRNRLAGVRICKGRPEDSVKRLIDAFKVTTQSDAVKEFAKKNLLPIDGRTGEDANKIFAEATQTQSWLLYDIKEAKRSPQELGIDRLETVKLSRIVY